MRRTTHPALRLRIAGSLLLALVLGATTAGAQERSALGGAYPGAPTPAQRNQWLDQGDGRVHVLLVRQGDRYPVPESSIYLLVGAGANITVQSGPNGLLLVNSGKAALSTAILTALHSISSEPLRTIVDTGAEADETGGNLALGRTGRSVTGGDVSHLIGKSAGITQILAALPVLDRMSQPGSPELQPEGAWPTDTYTADTKDFWFNGESIRLYHARAAHADGDTMVYFRHSDVVCAGDVYSTTGYPVIDLQHGGSIQGVIAALNRLIYQVMIPGPQNDGGTLVIPNHGHLSGYSEVVFYQEMLIIIRDRIQHMIDQGMTLSQVQAARPTFEYDGRYGADSGMASTAHFVEAVYRSLKRARSTP